MSDHTKDVPWSSRGVWPFSEQVVVGRLSLSPPIQAFERLGNAHVALDYRRSQAACARGLVEEQGDRPFTRPDALVRRARPVKAPPVMTEATKERIREAQRLRWSRPEARAQHGAAIRRARGSEAPATGQSPAVDTLGLRATASLA